MASSTVSSQATHELARLLRERKPAIVDAWVREVRRAGIADEVSDNRPALIDDLPGLLDRAALRVERGATTGASPGAARHALHRMGQGVALDQVLRELGVLREVIVATCARELPDLGPGALVPIHRTIDDAMVVSSQSFATERGRVVQRERRLREAEAQKAVVLDGLARQRAQEFETLAEAMPQLVWTARADGTLDYVNSRSAQFFGRSAAVLLGTQWQQTVHPEDRQRVVEAWARAVEHGGPYEVEQRLLHRDGTWRWHLTRAVGVLDEGGRVQKWLGTSTDISELKRAHERIDQSEREFRTAVEAMPQLVWTAGPDGRLEYLNPRLASYLGERAEAFLESRWQQVVHPEDLEHFEQVWGGAIARGEPFEVERRILRHDSVYHWFLTRAVPLRGEDGRVVKWLGTSTDIDDLKRAQAELHRRTEFEQQLIGIVSHDLRNPLSAILLGAHSLRRTGGLSERQERTVQRLTSAAERATRLVRELLDFTRVRLGEGIPIHREPLDFDTAVRRSLDELRLAHPGRVVELRSAGPVEGAWDEDRLGQAVTNLVNNAIAYSPPDTPIEVETRAMGAEVELSVHNEGKPIAPELLPHLFKPFRRGKDGGVEGGVGLGLFIVDSIVRAHGGHIEVRSDDADGTTFTITLPRGELTESIAAGPGAPPAP